MVCVSVEIRAGAFARPVRILAKLSSGRNHVSQLTRDFGMSGPLLHMHLKRLEVAGLVSNRVEISDGGTAMNCYELRPLDLRLTPELIAGAVPTLSPERCVAIL